MQANLFVDYQDPIDAMVSRGWFTYEQWPTIQKCWNGRDDKTYAELLGQIVNMVQHGHCDCAIGFWFETQFPRASCQGCLNDDIEALYSNEELDLTDEEYYYQLGNGKRVRTVIVQDTLLPATVNNDSDENE
jgi:hypothetical protein